MQPNQGAMAGQGLPPNAFGPPPTGYPNDKQQWGAYPPQQQQWGAYPPQPTPQYGFQQPGAFPAQPGGQSPQQYAQPQQAAFQQQQAQQPAARTNSGGGLNLSGSYVVNMDPDTATSMQFADKVVRNGFVRKVFGIVAVQLLITVGFTCVTMYAPGVKQYVRRNSWTFWTAWIFALVLMLVLACVEKARRVFPMNMILLGAFTVAQAWLVGILSAHYNESAVLLAFAVTAAAVLAISIFAINTKIDVTRWGTLLLVALVAFIVLLLFGIFLRSKILHLVIAGIACLLFSAYLIYDIQLVMGGRYYSISPDEYVFAALNIYLDIINLFMWILAIIGLSSNN